MTIYGPAPSVGKAGVPFADGMGLSTYHRERPAWYLPLLYTPQCRRRSIPHGGGDDGCARVLVICECPHSMYFALYAAHDPLVGAHPPSLAGLVHIWPF